MRYLVIVLRILVPAAIIAAVIGQIATSLDFWQSKGITDPTTQLVNFFSFFTIDSNLFSVVILLVGAVLLLRTGGADPDWFQVARLSVVTYMVTTGVVYNLLLRGVDLPQGSTLGWSNEILHVVAPIYLLLDWLFAPGRHPLSFTAVRVVIIFPIVWVIYTLIRGPLVFDQVFGNDYWYPYPFLNPATASEGYFTVAFFVVLISVVICGVGIGMIAIAKRRALVRS